MTDEGNLNELARLLTPGTVGFYNFFEVTEIVAFADETKTPTNVFTIAVAVENTEESALGKRYLGPRIKLRSLKGWAFGVVRYCRPISELATFIPEITSCQRWRASGHDLRIGSLSGLPSKFIPPDALNSIPFNRILGNKCSNGSHVLEWADPKKELLLPFFDNSARLQELTDQVNQRVPIRIGALSDRLGNIVLQFPVTVIAAEFVAYRHTNGLTLQISWHPKATPRDLMVTCERNADGFISSFTSVRATGTETLISLASDEGHYRATIAELHTGRLLTATGGFDFLDEISIDMHFDSNTTRTFVLRDALEQETKQEIGIITPRGLRVGTPYVDPNGGFTQARMYREELSLLHEQRSFVQYAKEHSDTQAERARALADIRYLVNRNCDAGAWLWDPFLSAKDILETLFFCNRRNVDLRALTSAIEPPGDKLTGAQAEDFVTRQRRIFTEAHSNLEGLRLEFRRKYRQYGVAFHDRFVIFPRTPHRSTLVWSLGTSVNSVGRQHHILQQVDNGQAIMDAFLDLWNQLTEPRHLIWRVP